MYVNHKTNLFFSILATTLFLTSCKVSNSIQGNFVDPNEDGSPNSGNPPVVCDSPSISITSPSPGALVYSANKNSFTISGTCSENNGNIEITGSTTGSTTCISNSWSINLNLSSQPEGSLNLQAAHTCAGSSNWVSDSIALNKDSVIDVLPSSLVDGVQKSSITESPVIQYTSASDLDSGILKHQVRVLKSSDSSVVKDWSDHTSGDPITSLSLTAATSYYVQVRALDNAGNISSVVQSDGWIAGQSAGSMNLSFATTGVHWTTGTGGDQNNSFNDVLVDSLGRILVTGAIKNSGEYGDIILHRLLSNGDLDTSFDTDGKITINLTAFDFGMSLYEDSSSNIILGGAYTTTENPYVTRFTSTGATDTTFGSSGWGIKSISGENYARDMAVDPSTGSYYLVGDDYGDTAYVVRFTSTGAVDNSFSSDGHMNLNTHTYAYAKGAAVDQNGKLVVVGYVQPNGAADDWAAIVWRVNSDGTLDTTFNSGSSYKLLDDQLSINVNEEAYAILIDAANNYYVLGNAADSTSIHDIMIWKLNDQAQADTSYGNLGVVQLSDVGALNASAKPASGKFDLAGNIVLTGYANNGSNDDLLVARITPSGAYDTTFGSSGKLLLSSLRGYNGHDYGFNLDIGPDGKIYVSGRSYFNATRADAIVIQID